MVGMGKPYLSSAIFLRSWPVGIATILQKYFPVAMGPYSFKVQLLWDLTSLTTKKQTTKFSSAYFQQKIC